MSIIDSLPSEMPFMGVSAATTREFGDNGRYRLLLYGAYSAFGLIGTEHNGIAIVKLAKKGGKVILSRHMARESGWYGPSQQQLQEFGRICEMEWEDFR